MATTVVNTVHSALPGKAQTVAHANLRKAKTPSTDDLRKAQIEADEMIRVGQAIERTRLLAGMTLDRFAREIERNPRQVSAWIRGKERPHFDAIFAVKCLQQPLVIALAELAHAGVEIDTVIRVRIKESA